MCFFFNDTATTEIYTYCHTLSLHDALPIFPAGPLRTHVPSTASRPRRAVHARPGTWPGPAARSWPRSRSEEHTSELQSLMRISYAVFCLKKKKSNTRTKVLHNDINV